MEEQRSGFRVPSPTSIYYGWWIVLAAFVIAFVYSGFFFYDFTLFVTPIRDEIPDVGGAIDPAFLVATLVGTALSPVLGGVFDRVGPKPVVGGGMLLGAAGFAIMGIMAQPWHLYVGLTLAGLGPIVFFAGGVSATVNWFDRLRGRAVGLTVVGLGAGGILTRPSLYVMEEIGWRNSFLLMAAVVIVLLLPLAFVLRRAPEDHGMRPDGDPPNESSAEGVTQAPILYGLTFTQILRTPTFWLLSMLMFLSFWPIGSLQIHQGAVHGGRRVFPPGRRGRGGRNGVDHDCGEGWGRVAGRFHGSEASHGHCDAAAGRRHRGVRAEQAGGELVPDPVLRRVLARFRRAHRGAAGPSCDLFRAASLRSCAGLPVDGDGNGGLNGAVRSNADR